MVHHQVNEYREEASEQRCAVPYLPAVDIAVPCRAPMHELVPQHIEAVEKDRQDPDGVMLSQSLRDRVAAPLQSPFPVSIACLTVLVGPERGKDMPIVEQNSDLVREALPDHVIDAMGVIQTHECPEERLKTPAFAVRLLFDVDRVGRIEADPEQDKSNIVVLIFLFGACQPAQGTVHSQGERKRKSLPEGPLFCLQHSVVERARGREAMRHCQLPVWFL